MSVGGNRSPYRPPCGYASDDPLGIWRGSHWQHYRPEHSAIVKIKNTTDCTPTDDPPTEPVSPNVYIPYDPIEYLNLSACRKIGFKYVVARKAWHGMFGWTDAGQDICCIPNSGGDCCNHPAQGVPTTKYLTMQRKLEYSWAAFMDDGTGFSESGTVTYTRSIDRLSGVETEDDCSWDSDYDFASNPSDGFDFGERFSDFDHLLNGGLNCGTVDVGEPSGYNLRFADGYTPSAGETVSKTITNTTVTLTYRIEQVIPHIGTAFQAFTATWTLSNAYTSGDVNDDVKTLLATWNLADDAQYPWRTDTDCTRGPIVSYFEKPASQPSIMDVGDIPSSPGYVSPCGFTDSENYFDGSIIGAPLTTGSDAYCDARHANFSAPEGCSQPVSYGASSPYPHATQWSNDLDASCCLPGAFAAYNTMSIPGAFCGPGGPYFGDHLIRSKYAEVILLTQPSHNFARPCGSKDAETIDQTTITTCYGADSPCNLGDLRWSDLTVPCATGAWNDNFVKGDWCLLTWSFNYRDVGENTRLRTQATDDHSGTPGDGMDVCEYNAGLAQLRPTTGPWSAINCSQQCSAFVPCCPAVVYLTPNGESSTNSQTFAPDNLTLDEFYGSQWQQIPQQWMTDPLWQRPVISEEAHTDGKAWLEDDGTGRDDTDTEAYYPQRPYEEARCALPSGAPTLPSGCYLGVLSVDDINSGSTAGNIVPPPAAGSCWMPVWLWAINRLNNTDGRFSCIYNDPMAVCEDDPEVEPA